MEFKLAMCKCRVGLLRLQPVALATWEQSGRSGPGCGCTLYQKFAKAKTQMAFQKRHVGRCVCQSEPRIDRHIWNMVLLLLLRLESLRP
jgi:hypothetical protein